MHKYVVLFILVYLVCGIGNTQESHTISWSGVTKVSHNDSVFNVLDFDNSIYDSTISLNKIYFDQVDYQLLKRFQMNLKQMVDL